MEINVQTATFCANQPIWRCSPALKMRRCPRRWPACSSPPIFAAAPADAAALSTRAVAPRRLLLVGLGKRRQVNARDDPAGSATAVQEARSCKLPA